MAKRVDLHLSDVLREIEARRDHDDPSEEDPRASIEITDDGEEFIDTALVPWRVPRPPDAPPPRKRTGVRGPEPDRERRAYVEQLWRSGYADTEIVDIVGSRFPQYAATTVRSDIRRVRKVYVAADSAPDVIAARKAQMVATFQDLAREARASGDRSTARYAYDKICRIYGLYAPTKIEATTTQRIEVGLQIEVIVNHLDAEGLRALEVVMHQLEAAGIFKSRDQPSQPELAAGSVIDVDAIEGDDDEDHDDDDDLD